MIHFKPVFLFIVGENVEKMLKILIVMKDGLLGISSIKNVADGIIKNYSSNPWHVSYFLYITSRNYITSRKKVHVPFLLFFVDKGFSKD